MTDVVAEPRGFIFGIGAFACAIVAAGLLAVVSLRTNLERSCTTRDTPYLDPCERPPEGSAAERETLKARIDRNPGDANASTELAMRNAGTEHAKLVQIASRLAPHEPNLLLHRAAGALEQQDVEAAVEPLIELAQYRDDPRAASAIAALLAMGHAPLFAPHLVPGSQWLEPVLARVRQDRHSFAGALPLVAQALSLHLLQPASVRAYIRELKAAHAWADAYGLWLALHGNKPLPALFNPNFDTPPEPDGFDWEVPTQGAPSRLGALVDRRRDSARGGQLDVRFTGRPISLPMVRQYLFLGSGRYRLQGEYQARPLRTENGLVWTVRCGAKVAGRSGPLADTSGEWRQFTIDFILAPGCGLVASLELETFSPTEAALGLRGKIAFESFDLAQLAR